MGVEPQVDNVADAESVDFASCGSVGWPDVVIRSSRRRQLQIVSGSAMEHSYLEAQVVGHLRLRFRPGHDRNRADAVLRAAFDDPVAVGHVDQNVALPVEEADDLKRLE